MSILIQAAHKKNSQNIFAIFAICQLSAKCSGPERTTKHQTGVTPSAQWAWSLSAQPAVTPVSPGTTENQGLWGVNQIKAILLLFIPGIVHVCVHACVGRSFFNSS